MAGTSGPRVVSLVPSVTETLLAWGVVPVACTRFCEQPSLPHVGGTKDPDVAGVLDLRPDLVVVDEEENRREDAEALADGGLTVHATAVRSVDDVWPTLVALAASVDASRPERLDLPAPVPVRRTAFVPIWRRPWMAIGGDTYATSLLAHTGTANVVAAARPGERYPTVTLDEVAEARPDVVLAPSEPYPFTARHVPELSAIAPVELVDGRDLFWWGVRTPAAARRLTA